MSGPKKLIGARRKRAIAGFDDTQATRKVMREVKLQDMKEVKLQDMKEVKLQVMKQVKLPVESSRCSCRTTPFAVSNGREQGHERGEVAGRVFRIFG